MIPFHQRTRRAGIRPLVRKAIGIACAIAIGLVTGATLTTPVVAAGLPADDAAHLAAAYQDLQAERYQAALQTLSDLQTRHPHHPDTLIGLAQAHLELGQLTEAFSLLQLQRTLYPSQAAGHYLLGLLFLRSGLPESAVSTLSQAVAIQPGNELFRMQLARALAATGQPYAAASQYGWLLERTEAAGRRPDPELVYEMADLAARLEIRSDAERLYRLLIALEPSGARARIARDWLNNASPPDSAPPPPTTP
ncbi:MAG: tetratricopeptide repeat protein [Nitrospirota bacterium]|nr:tetratricopeptide repeat protein [Nitrospirota bacterium]